MSKAIFKLADNARSFTDESQPTNDPKQMYLMPGEVKELERTRTVNDFFRGGGIVHATQKELEAYQRNVEKESRTLVTDSQQDKDIKHAAAIQEAQRVIDDLEKQVAAGKIEIQEIGLEATADVNDLKDKLQNAEEIAHELSEKNESLATELNALKAAHDSLIKQTKSKK